MANSELIKHVVRSRFTLPQRAITENGEKLHKKYAIEIDEIGHKTVVESGHTNMYAKIQEATAECEIDNILAMVMQGDTTALNRAQAAYLDTTDMPKSLQEAQNAIIRLKNEFDSLPIDTRREFNFSPEQYINEYGTEKWQKAIGLHKEKPVNNTELPIKEKPTIEKEVIANE